MHNSNDTQGAANTVNIRPGVNVLAVLRHLNYKPWHALAEYVDNSIQSYHQNIKRLRKIHGDDFKLVVQIDIDTSSPAQISIRDNAAGIEVSDFDRAFRPAAIPPDRTGLAEFGMGMKSASCWFSPKWHVRTTALGDSITRTVKFEIENIINDGIEELEIHEDTVAPENHYTEIVLSNLFHAPVGRTSGKIKEHLTDIYRAFIRENKIELKFNGETLEPKEPTILEAPYFRDNDGPSRLWRKEIAFDLGNGMSVRGFAALYNKLNIKEAGFSLFRRNRVIVGSADEGYRPAYIFGTPTRFRYQRLYGELHLEGFEVSHTKDGFRWDENEQPFLELLREHLDEEDLPLLKQGEGYRARPSRTQLSRTAERAIENTTRAIEENLPSVLENISEEAPVETSEEEGEHVDTLASKVFNIRFRNNLWKINVELTEDAAESQWLVLSDVAASTEHPRCLDIRVSLAHPFMVRYAQSNTEDIEALLRVAAALALAEILARDSGVRLAGTIRRNLNEILHQAFSEA